LRTGSLRAVGGAHKLQISGARKLHTRWLATRTSKINGAERCEIRCAACCC
jgi:hypothetical protein